MEKPRHDLPTLHQPASIEENIGIDRYNDLGRELRPLPTPPHKQPSYGMQRPYTSMSYKGHRCDKLGTLPTLLTDTNWRTRRAKKENEELPEYSEYDKSYDDLSTKKAYRHPHPGAPKGREGCIGGTWRHTKEAVGYGPGRLMWIDGIVTLYDDWLVNSEKPWDGRNTALTNGNSNRMVNLNQYRGGGRFVPQRHPIPDINKPHRWYSSNQPQPLLSTAGPPGRSAPLGKYKGFYSMAQAYS